MNLLHIPRPSFSGRARVEMPLGEWPEEANLTPAQIEQRREARQRQAGKPKSANRVQR